MKTLRITTQPDALDVLINEALDQSKGSDILSEEYKNRMAQIERLFKLKEHSAPKPVSRDTMVIAATNLIGIGMILGWERAHVVTSKALGFVMKSR